MNQSLIDNCSHRETCHSTHFTIRNISSNWTVFEVNQIDQHCWIWTSVNRSSSNQTDKMLGSSQARGMSKRMACQKKRKKTRKFHLIVWTVVDSGENVQFSNSISPAFQSPNIALNAFLLWNALGGAAMASKTKTASTEHALPIGWIISLVFLSFLSFSFRYSLFAHPSESDGEIRCCCYRLEQSNGARHHISRWCLKIHVNVSLQWFVFVIASKQSFYVEL